MATCESITAVTLKLSEEEAYWLMSSIQNPIGVSHPMDEAKEDQLIRLEIFNTLKERLDARS